MTAEALMLMAAGMGSVLAFLVFLVGLMYAAAAIFRCAGSSEETAHTQDDGAVVAALAAVALKKQSV